MAKGSKIFAYQPIFVDGVGFAQGDEITDVDGDEIKKAVRLGRAGDVQPATAAPAEPEKPAK